MTGSKELIQGYLEVVNKSLDEGAKHFPWKQILGAAEKQWEGANIGLGINDPGDDTPEVHTLEFKDGAFRYLSAGKVDTRFSFEADRNFMKHVVDNPEDYINSPMKIAGAWLRSSVNVGDDTVEKH